MLSLNCCTVHSRFSERAVTAHVTAHMPSGATASNRQCHRPASPHRVSFNAHRAAMQSRYSARVPVLFTPNRLRLTRGKRLMSQTPAMPGPVSGTRIVTRFPSIDFSAGLVRLRFRWFSVRLNSTRYTSLPVSCIFQRSRAPACASGVRSTSTSVIGKVDKRAA